MSDTFTSDVYPVVLKYVNMRLRDEELRGLAVVLAWWGWTLYQRQDKGEDLPPSVWARVGVRWAMAGRDLPGVQPSKFRDIWDRLDRWQGAGMQNLMDRR